MNDPLIRRFDYPSADAIAFHDWCVREGHIAMLRPIDRDTLAVDVLRSGGWNPSAPKPKA